MDIKTLVVDNNPVLLKAVSTILSQEGCMVKTAGTGLEALEILEEYDPEIVFTDLIMPLVSGEQLCRILRNNKKHRNIFIVVLSAIILEDQKKILQDINCDLFIAKGNLKEIRQHIRGALHTFDQRKKIALSEQNKKDTRIPFGLKSSEVTSELLSEKRHLNMIFANLDEGILELSNNGKIVAANPAALDILCNREESLIGLNFAEAIDWGHLRVPIMQWAENQLIHRGMGAYEILEESPIQFKGRVIIGTLMAVAEADDVFGLCILRDITRQYQAEKHNKELDNAIKLVKKMDALSCMAGGVAHDFNNLLTVICGNLDIISHYGKNQSSVDRVKLIEQARKAALVAVDLTRQISCFSNLGIVSREAVGIGRLVRTAVDIFFENEPADYIFFAGSDDCQVHVDPEEISQAIANVLKNGCEAAAGGRIEIRIGKSTFDTPRLMSGQYVSAGTYAKVEIRDFGKGIEREQLLRIFDPYYSTKERGAVKGMGLGLTVVYATLRNHGGHVVVHSEPGEGTTVVLYLPIMQDGKEDRISEKTEVVRDRYVLLIEPDDQMREIGRIMLEHLGHLVIKAAKRAEATREMKRFVNDPLLTRPLIILSLSDINGESAVETCRILHEMDSNLQIIAMSGTILDPVMEECWKYGFATTLPMPYSMDSLKHVVGMVLNT
ncbi:MAG: response regulator [Proteobacteria bacterium]|nr:response regulator [Pseudomonadota bacterium]